MPVVEERVTFIRNRRSQRIEQQLLRFEWEDVVEPPVDHERRYRDPRRVMQGIDERRLRLALMRHPAGQQHRRAHTRLHREDWQCAGAAETDAYETDAFRVHVRTRFEVVDCASEIPAALD